MEVNEAEEEEYCFDRIFDFSEFLNQQINTDCCLILSNEQHTKIRCHRNILSTASGFFQNAFTSGMEEEKTAEVDIRCNPLNLFPEVLKFLYTSLIEINDDNIMAIFEIAYFYDIKILEEKIKEILSFENASKIMHYTKFCYDNELKEGLNALVPYMANYYKNISINEFSENLDTKTFCKVLVEALENGTFVGNIKDQIDSFLNGTSPNEEEIKEINYVINNYYTVS